MLSEEFNIGPIPTEIRRLIRCGAPFCAQALHTSESAKPSIGDAILAHERNTANLPSWILVEKVDIELTHLQPLSGIDNNLLMRKRIPTLATWQDGATCFIRKAYEIPYIVQIYRRKLTGYAELAPQPSQKKRLVEHLIGFHVILPRMKRESRMFGAPHRPRIFVWHRKVSFLQMP